MDQPRVRGRVRRDLELAAAITELRDSDNGYWLRFGPRVFLWPVVGLVLAVTATLVWAALTQTPVSSLLAMRQPAHPSLPLLVGVLSLALYIYLALPARRRDRSPE